MSGDLPLRLGTASARRMAPDHPDVDDFAQEAALRVAEVADTKPGASTAYLGGVARNRVRDMILGRPFTGHTNTGRGPVDPLRLPGKASLDGLGGDEESTYFPASDGGLGRAEWRTLRPEIEAAIDSIPSVGRHTPRRVARLVAAGFSASEAGRRLGLTDVAGRKAWQFARSHLRIRLAHLEELVA